MRLVLKSLITAVIVAGFLIGCGSSTRNEQGTSITLTRILQALSAGGDGTIGLTGLILPFSEATGSAFAAVEVQNNLGTQTFRTERVNLRYTVPGANINVPDFFAPIGQVLAPNVMNVPDGTGGSTLPDTGMLGTVAFSDFPVLPFEILSFLLLNESSLPETPFTAVAMISVEGVTSAGDRLETNVINFPITFTSLPSGSELVGGVDGAADGTRLPAGGTTGGASTSDDTATDTAERDETDGDSDTVDSTSDTDAGSLG